MFFFRNATLFEHATRINTNFQTHDTTQPRFCTKTTNPWLTPGRCPTIF